MLINIEMSLNLNMLINGKMPTIVGILTFISKIKTKSESLKAISIYYSAFYFFELLKFHAQLI